jgi:hypothetical protein
VWSPVEYFAGLALAGARWAVEECFWAAKEQSGLDQYQVRKWGPLTTTSPLLAHAFLAATDPESHAGLGPITVAESAVSWQ